MDGLSNKTVCWQAYTKVVAFYNQKPCRHCDQLESSPTKVRLSPCAIPLVLVLIIYSQ